MTIFSPLGASLEQIFDILLGLIILRDNAKHGRQARQVNLEELKVLEYLVHVRWNDHGMGRREQMERSWALSDENQNRLGILRKRLRILGHIGKVNQSTYVPFEFFHATKEKWVGPYAANWSLRVVKASPLSQLHWNNPFDFVKSVNFNLLTEPLSDHIKKVGWSPSGRANQFFTRVPIDSRERRDFTVRFWYEEDDYALMGGERWPILIHHVIYRRDVDFALDRLEYQLQLTSIYRAANGPEPTRYHFDWCRNLVEHKIHHRFYQHWEGDKKWVVRERGSGRFVRGRRNAIEEVCFRLWMTRDEYIHPAWRGSLKDFEKAINAEMDEEWQIDYQDRIRHAYEYWPKFGKEF
ncbi:hypothetical protein C8R42DRAFT_723389 [Lentinula raphanica]|nr:hypothetical protein C8R42DRAFT_723389 [Lentinula raphanica]